MLGSFGFECVRARSFVPTAHRRQNLNRMKYNSMEEEEEEDGTLGPSLAR